MAVYTQVPLPLARALFAELQLGELQNLQACSGGIENTNYFADTDKGQYVLTLFERLNFEQLPFYLHLMRHLAQKGIPTPMPHANAAGTILHTLCDKPAAVVDRLPGRNDSHASLVHCQAVGRMLAKMHLAGQDFALTQPNLRALNWWNETAPAVLPHLTQAQKNLLTSELAYQNHIHQSAAYAALSRGPIHADLFRDNVMFEGDTLTGFFDFYFAGTDALAFDLAVCLNDWCVDLVTGQPNIERQHVFIQGYQSVRPLHASERTLLPALLRAAALRFWLSRMWDFYLPRKAAVLTAHDPNHFERILQGRLNTLAVAPFQ